MIEKRSETRCKLNSEVKVFDKSTNNFIGIINDIGLTGVKLECITPLTPGTEYRLRLEIPSFPENVNQFLIQADCIWWMKDVRSDVYNCGMEITFISENDKIIVEKIINELCE